MLHPVPTLKETPSQTAGHYVHIGLTPNFAEIRGIYPDDPGSSMLTPSTKGERIVVSGRIVDGAAAPVGDAVVECWQADADGSFATPMAPNSNSAPAFTGWGRQPVNAEGVFSFETIKPGSVTGPDGKPMAPHVVLWIVARGINIGLHTRMYFGDEDAANAQDPILARIEHRSRLETLIGKREGAKFVFDIHLQGDRETVFFDI